MALQVSTGFKTRILGSESFADIFHLGAILLFEDDRPPTADGPAPAPVAVITQDGNAWAPPDTGFGLRFAQIGPYILKGGGGGWKLRASADTPGVTWARLVGPVADNGVVNYDLPRIDFDVGLVGASTAELLLPQLAFTMGEALTIGAFTYTFPPLAL